MTDMNITDRVLAILQTRFPKQFEIAVLQAQNEALRARLAELETSHASSDDSESD